MLCSPRLRAALFPLLSRYNMVHTHEDYASFILAGASEREMVACSCLRLCCFRAASELCLRSGRLQRCRWAHPRLPSLPPSPHAAAADHAEKGSRGPQSDSPTSDAYAPGYTNDTSFYTLRSVWLVGRS